MEFAKVHHKTRTRGKSGCGLSLGKLPNIWGSPLVFLPRPRCSLSVSGASCFLYFTMGLGLKNRQMFSSVGVTDNNSMPRCNDVALLSTVDNIVVGETDVIRSINKLRLGAIPVVYQTGYHLFCLSALLSQSSIGTAVQPTHVCGCSPSGVAHCKHSICTCF